MSFEERFNSTEIPAVIRKRRNTRPDSVATAPSRAAGTARGHLPVLTAVRPNRALQAVAVAVAAALVIKATGLSIDSSLLLATGISAALGIVAGAGASLLLGGHNQSLLETAQSAGVGAGVLISGKMDLFGAAAETIWHSSSLLATSSCVAAAVFVSASTCFFLAGRR